MSVATGKKIVITSRANPLPCVAWLVGLCLLAALLPGGVAAQEEQPAYSTDFEIPEVEESPFEFWGQAELRLYGRVLDKDSAAYKQRFYDDPQDELQSDVLLRLKPEFSLQLNELGLYARPRIDIAWSQLPVDDATPDEPSEVFFKEDRHWEGVVLLEEGFATWRPTPSFTFEAGKKVLKWGKGYAWNPVGFASRPKDVDDPDQSREGYLMAYADGIYSMQGPLGTIALTPVALPVWEHVNSGLAQEDTLLYGGKLYLLLFDTDIDLLAMTGHGYDTRLGLDFATNITENFAVHGEAALRFGYDKRVLDSQGNISTSHYDAWSFLLGLRYLTASDTTFILEYYRNGEGYTPREMRDYYRFVDRGFEQFEATGQSLLLQKSAGISSQYNRSSAGRDYLYFRVSQKEPLDILYLTPTMTIIANLGDPSFSLNPELSYMLTPDLELRPRLILPIGAEHSEFGEKLNSVRGELRLTYFY